MAEVESVPQMGYWAFRGKGGFLEILLGYANDGKFTKKGYTDGKEWFKNDKLNLGFLLPNLPYLIDGDDKLTEG
jgi:hypothetical protein